jgi:colicin import membrane protein
VKLDHTYILPTIFALIVHVCVAFIFMSEWQSDSQRTPLVEVKQRVEATLIDLDSLLALQKQIDTAADKNAADKKAADKKAADKKAADKKAADKKAADKKAADKKAADKKAADKKVADKKVADKKVADKKVADKKVADKKVADKKVADKKTAQQLAEVQQALDSLLDNEEIQTQALAQRATNGQAVASAIHYIRDEIRQRWVRPANARTGMVVELVIQLVPTGEIIHIEISYRDASATDAFVSSVDKAVRKVGRFDKLSQLNPVLFDANFRKFTLKFKPEDLRL